MLSLSFAGSLLERPPEMGCPTGSSPEGGGGGGADWDTLLKRPLRLSQQGPAGRNPLPRGPAPHLRLFEGDGAGAETWRTPCRGERCPGGRGLSGSPGS